MFGSLAFLIYGKMFVGITTMRSCRAIYLRGTGRVTQTLVNVPFRVV